MKICNPRWIWIWEWPTVAGRWQALVLFHTSTRLFLPSTYWVSALKALSSVLYGIHGVKEKEEALAHISGVLSFIPSLYDSEDKAPQLYTPEVYNWGKCNLESHSFLGMWSIRLAECRNDCIYTFPYTGVPVISPATVVDSLQCIQASRLIKNLNGQSERSKQNWVVSQLVCHFFVQMRVLVGQWTYVN